MQKPQLHTFIKAITTLRPIPTTPPHTFLPLRNPSESVIYLKNREIDAFIKRRNPNVALAVFHNTPLRDTVTYDLIISAFRQAGGTFSSNFLDSSFSKRFTSMINAYARNGMGKEGIAMLQAMTERGIKPDDVTFLCALNGCNHTGLVEEGRIVFESMKSLHGVDPDRRHFSCTMDLFCRAGLLHEAEEFLLQSQGKGEYFMWSSLLRSCRVHKNEEVGTKAAQVLVELDPDDPAVWLQASNFYAEIGKFDASRQIREVSLARKMTREIGHSLIEIRQ
ncbi:Pentatricopeptide repeat-containing protein, chloroplastic [Glycine soja]|uniref:Pentatricopeptide repeat-containing protein, chloroplastic n=1 Tax=Glycine soja TaxID=3848 RepID=A0A0B2QP60_GLYSO|nr:Pentatricopeptide repeat-containing protein, chloroplastic [Glycine soja]